MANTQSKLLELLPPEVRAQIKLEVVQELNAEKQALNNAEWKKHFDDYMNDRKKDRDANENNPEEVTPGVKRYIENLNKGKK